MDRDDFLFRGSLAELDPAVYKLIELEQERQARKLIMIPSESSSPLAVREALASAFMNIYAEGYPNPETHWLTEEEILDYEHHLAYYRRYGDRRYYRGVEYADVVEMLACRRCAEAFATDTISADNIYVNVQPLSGAAANVAVQQALLKPGDTIMGMALSHGGHLTHGSPANLSGRLYNAVAYHVNEQTELLDYDEIEALALKHRPRLIIAGYTSYPRLPDWSRFRQIADRVGAYLLADIAHVAGMVVAGAFPSPLGFADVITFTTHKTLCGPRGACILTTDPLLARKIDQAVFPGLQGGPHVNKFAAIAVAFRLAQTERFRLLQHQIVKNAVALAGALSARGLRVPCGGTDTHLVLLDCKTVRGRDGTPLMGESLAAILDLIGIVVNKNTIPGDRSAAYASGIRLGTPWVTQRGLREPEMEQLADIINRTMCAIEPFAYEGVSGPVYRGKIEFDVLEELRLEVAELAGRAGIDFEIPCTGYPHHCLIPELRPRDGEYTLIEVEGNLAAAFVDQITPHNIAYLRQGHWQEIALLERDGRVMSHALVQRPNFGHYRYHFVVPVARAQRVLAWLRDLSDGYIRFDDSDPWAKLPGAVVVRDLGKFQEQMPGLKELGRNGFTPPFSCKPYFIGLHAAGYTDPPGEPLPRFAWQEIEYSPRHTPLFDWHISHNATMASFDGWEMPLWYTSISDEHCTVRGAAGLFDLSCMGIIEVSGPHASYFLNLVTTNDVNALRPGMSQYAFLLDPTGHVLDDTMIYMLAPSRYLMVVNTANKDRDWAWLQAVNEREVRIDELRPWARTSFQAALRDLHDPHESHDWLVDVALQGPRARDVLLALLDAAPDPKSTAVTEIRERVRAMGRGRIIRALIPTTRAPGGIFDLLIARTGYTGEPIGFELFVHPDLLTALWEQLLEVGEPLGLRPVGMGARDSLRIEAGLPMYGHELAGPLNIRPDEAGFAGYVKLHKPFFIGRQACIEHARQRRMTIVRFRVEEKNVPFPRPGDVVTECHGRIIGQVTSCAVGTDGYLTGLACVEKSHAVNGCEINIFPTPIYEVGDRSHPEPGLGDRLAIPRKGRVLERFMKRQERPEVNGSGITTCTNGGGTM